MDLATHRVTPRQELHPGPTQLRLMRMFRELTASGILPVSNCSIRRGRDIHVEVRTVDVHVRRLRKALGAHGDDDGICTVRGAGYAPDVDRGVA